MRRRFITSAALGTVAVITLAACGSLSPLAGTGQAGSAGDGGLAAAAKLAGPQDVSIDPNGVVCVAPAPTPNCPNLFVADTDNNRIRRVGDDDAVEDTAVPNGPIDTVLKGKVLGATLTRPRGVLAPGFGVVFVSDSGNNRVLRYDLNTLTATLVAGGGAGVGVCPNQAKLKDPTGLAIDEFGNLLIADTGNNVIRMVVGAGQLSPPPCNPLGLPGDPGTIQTIAGTGSSGFKDASPATLGKLNAPRDVAYSAVSDTFYVADSGNNRVRAFQLGGPIWTVAGKSSAGWNGDCGAASAAQLNGPSGLALVPAFSFPFGEALYVADTGNNRLRRIDLGGTPFIVTSAYDYQAPISGPNSLPMTLKGLRGIDAVRVPAPPVGQPGDGVVIADTGNNMVGGIAFADLFQRCGLP